MNRASALACSLLVASAVPASVAGQPSPGLDALTAPAAMLPAGCALAPAPSERIGNGRVVSGFWSGLPITSNPWAGEAPPVLAEIRTRMYGLPRMPDGPPDARIAKQIGRTLVEGMSGYAAFYRQEAARVSVYALRSADAREWTRSSLPGKDDGTGQAFARIRQGPLAVLIAGDRGACFAALERHLRAVVSTADAVHGTRPAALLLDRAYMHDVRARGGKGDAAITAAIAALEDAKKALAIVEGADIPGAGRPGRRRRPEADPHDSLRAAAATQGTPVNLPPHRCSVRPVWSPGSMRWPMVMSGRKAVAHVVCVVRSQRRRVVDV
jgi:hypothetical protein